MEIIRTVKEWRAVRRDRKHISKQWGFVPTMGYLHDGHLSLVNRARKENDILAVSIFVNPTQFVQGEDFEVYPRDEVRDCMLLEKCGVEYVFCPTAEEMYPPNSSTTVKPPLQSEGWCGASRPGHFEGVCTVVSMLFNIVEPNIAYFGRKDAQQAAVITQMVQDLRFPVQIQVCPIVRENDGLAMSSRNTYLSPEERQKALILFRTLSQGLKLFKQGESSADTIIDEGRRQIELEEGVRLDYLGIVDQNIFKSIHTVEEGHYYLGAIFVGKTRLIDNVVFER